MINEKIEKNIFNNYLKNFDNTLNKVINETYIPSERLKQAILYSLFPGGKRFRPMLVYLCGNLLSTKNEATDIIAISIELMHSFSLVHDDLPAMDDDDFRRDKPSCHRAFDEATAILAGDAMQALAIDILITKLPEYLDYKKIIEISHILLAACGPSGMVSGQSLDISELSNPFLNEETIAKIHYLKTGQLIKACIQMIIAASNPTDPEIASLNCFADNLGILFQMQDDYLDQYDSENALGKCRSSDLANNKITYANIYSKKDLAALINKHIDNAHQALKIFENKAGDLIKLLSYLKSRIH